MGWLLRGVVVAVVLLVGIGGDGSGVGAEIRLADGDDCPAVVAPVSELYRAFFLREPDAGGLDYWTRFVSSRDGNLDRAAQAFAESPEFVARYGQLDNESFVVQLYRNSFGREPDAEGLAFWTEDIDSGHRTRGQVVLFWSFSEEFLGGEASLEEYSPLRISLFRQEVWCGTGSRIFEFERLPLDTPQQLGVRLIQGADLYGQITGHAEDGTTVLSVGNLLREPGSDAIGLYVHHNLNQAVAYYRVSITCSDCDWVVTSSGHDPFNLT